MQQAARVFNLHEVEVDLEREIIGPLDPQHRDYAPPSSLPDYLTHRDGADDIGKLSAEAVAKSYEAAAQEIERMGAELKERTALCVKMVEESNLALTHVREIAAEFREAGKLIFLRIEDASLMTKEVRETCNTLRAKIAEPVSSS